MAAKSSPRKTTARDAFTYYGYSLGWSTVRKLPEKRAYALFDRFAIRTWRKRGAAVRQYEKNIHRVLPNASPADLRELSNLCLRSYARYWCDTFRMPDWSRSRILELPVQGLEHIDQAQAAGRGPVIVCPHAGNYDYGAAFLAAKYGAITTIAERLKPEKLYQRFLGFRAQMGVEVLPTGTPQIMDKLQDRVQDDILVGIVGERDLSRKGIPVDFFGEQARMPAGSALLARRTGSDLLPVSFWYEGSQACARVYEPITVDPEGDEKTAVAKATQQWADQIARGISEHPQDWHMLQPLWTADLDPRRDPMRQKSDG